RGPRMQGWPERLPGSIVLRGAISWRVSPLRGTTCPLAAGAGPFRARITPDKPAFRPCCPDQSPSAKRPNVELAIPLAEDSGLENQRTTKGVNTSPRPGHHIALRY